MTADVTDRASDAGRAVGAGLGLLVVALTDDAASFGDRQRWWAAIGAIVLGGVLADAIVVLRARLTEPGLGVLPAAGALAAIAACVPETDHLVVAATPAMLLLVLELVGRRQFPIEWYAVAVVAVGWGGLSGAAGRPSALAGALFAGWVFVLPLALSRVSRLPAGVPTIAAVVVGSIAALVMARTGGVSTSGWVPIVVSVAACAAVSFGLASVAVTRLSARPTRPGR